MIVILPIVMIVTFFMSSKPMASPLFVWPMIPSDVGLSSFSLSSFILVFLDDHDVFNF